MSDTLTVGEEKEADDLLSALTVIAHNIETKPKAIKKKKVVKKESKFRSRFFYRPTNSLSQDVAALKKNNAQRSSVDLIDEEVTRRLAQYDKELPDSLRENLEAVREFFLQELGPLLLGAQAGTTQAQEVVKRLLNANVRTEPFIQFERMLNTAASIKMAKFIASYTSLSESEVKRLLDEVAPKKEVYFPIPSLGEERRARPRPTPAAPPKPAKEKDNEQE